MTYYDLLKQYVSTGSALSEYQFDRIKKDAQLLNSYFYSRNRELKWDNLEVYEVEFIDNNPKYFNKFDVNNLHRFLVFSRNSDAIADKIIKLGGDALNYYAILSLLDYSSNKDLIIDEIIKAKGEKLDPDSVDEIIEKYSNKDYIINRLINLQGESLTHINIHFMVSNSSNKDITIKKIINIKGKKLTWIDITELLYQSDDPSETYKFIKKIGREINSYDMDHISHGMREHVLDRYELLKKAGIDIPEKYIINIMSSR